MREGQRLTSKRKKGVEGEVLDLRAQFLVLKGEMFDLRGNSVCRVNAGRRMILRFPNTSTTLVATSTFGKV